MLGKKMGKKAQRISVNEFSDRFTKIASRRLATLPAEEPDKRIKNVERTASGVTRVDRPVTRRVEEIRQSPLRYRTD